ncbi:MAG: 4Fe-4S binding protein [Chloroflexi bacterium]|nr:4Fe-4S binding protein [Chloroflexota bacterium]MBU1749423.1 4Fe-4S binding protein [Chloroflexota bacterium]
MDVYEQLHERFASHPLGAPQNAKFLEILRILFTPEEAELSTHIGFYPSRASDIAEAAGVPEARAVELCESMANKGILYGFQVRDQQRYCLLPTAPGLFEFPLMLHNRESKLAIDWNRLGQLWEEYYHEGWGHELSSSPTPIARVLPIGEAIPVDLRVFPFEEAARYIREAKHIGLSDCPCRTSKPSCDAPVDVCLSFNYSAKFLSERDAAHLITPEQALEVLQRAEDAGLVHCASNTTDRIDYICNCCPCCCDILGVMTRLKDSPARVESNFRAVVNAETCIACGDCLDRCPMDAIALGDVAEVDQARCIGCGLCATTCPSESIVLERVSDAAPPADYREMVTLIAGEKGRLEAFAENLYPS